jgi:hypothetical protein
MLGFFDTANALGVSPTDHILMIEFPNSALSALDRNTTLFNLYDNTTGDYLFGGQSDTNTLAGWVSSHPLLAGDTLRYVEIGIGYAGGSGPAVSMTVNSVDLTVPEPTSLLLLFIMLGTAGLSLCLTKLRNRHRPVLTSASHVD